MGNEGEYMEYLVSNNHLCLNYLICYIWFYARPSSEEACAEREIFSPLKSLSRSNQECKVYTFWKQSILTAWLATFQP